MSQRFLPEWDGVTLALSQRHHGAMSFNRHKRSEVAQNRRSFLAEMGLELGDCVGAELVHGDRVALVNASDKGRGSAGKEGWIPKTDALITETPGLILTTTHADCAPIYFYSARRRAIGLAHAGWRGILAGLPHKVVESMQTHFACRPDELIIAVGPTICAEHYSIGLEVADAFKERFGQEVLPRFDHRVHLDLTRAIILDLASVGVPSVNIIKPTACTYCETSLSSWRRDGKAVLPMLALIVLIK
jgi:YfiH family protein